MSLMLHFVVVICLRDSARSLRVSSDNAGTDANSKLQTFRQLKCVLPVTVAARAMAWTAFALSNTEIVCSNPTGGMDVQCVHKVHSGFWKIVARKQIELATCGLWQITAKLWKFFYADRWNERPSLRFSVSCLWNGDCAGGVTFWTKSVTQTQRNDRTQFNKQPPSDYAIRDWQRRVLETGRVHDR
jgi:hypothetical protein